MDDALGRHLRRFEENRSNWNDRAALHEASGYGIDRLVDDAAFITPDVDQDRDRLGDLAGRDVIHLQCHLGTDTVALSRLGARRVVGLDLSDESLRRARSIARRCGADIEFVEANVYDARTAVDGEFDLVYTSLGVLCWLPDVRTWARVVAALLRPGGRFLVRDDHPIAMTLGEDVSQGFRVEFPYFEQLDPQIWDKAGSYVETPDGAPPMTNTVSHEWNHSVGEIITAVLDAGLVLEGFEESIYSAWKPWPQLMIADGPGYRLREGADRFPLQYVLTARKPG